MTAFASTADLADKTKRFDEVAPGLYAFTAEGDPNSGVIVGEEGVLVIDAQATPMLAREVIARVRTVTEAPILAVVLTHYHAVRVLGAAAYGAREIVASAACRRMIVERGAEDWASEFGRFPRLFRGYEEIGGLTWPTRTFEGTLSLWLGRREVRLMQLGAGHTRGDIVAWVPDAEVMFTGDLVEKDSACYCGDAHFAAWPETLQRIAAFKPQAIVPGRGAALMGATAVQDAITSTAGFLAATYEPCARAAARGDSLKEAYRAVRARMDGPFGHYAIYEHCLPFNVARAYDEARGIEHPRIWTAERDREMWSALAA